MTQENLFAVRHSKTSVEAADSMRGTAETLRGRVFAFLKQLGTAGATDEEIQSSLEMPANTERPRRRELEMAGAVRDSGQTRLTKSGRKAVVWVVAA